MGTFYAPPKADLSVGHTDFDPTILAVTGRVGRVRWIAYTFAIWYLVCIGGTAVIELVASGNNAMRDALGIGCIGLMVVGFVIVSRRRLQDMNLGIAYVVLAFVPVLNFCFLFLMVFKRGDDGRNGYGKAPAPNNRALKIVATILPGIIALWAFAAFAVPVYFKYEARQRANAPDAPAWVRYTVPPSELKNP